MKVWEYTKVKYICVELVSSGQPALRSGMNHLYAKPVLAVTRQTA
jgi:hypothetical protein